VSVLSVTWQKPNTTSHQVTPNMDTREKLKQGTSLGELTAED
jgi:hypothetical protein